MKWRGFQWSEITKGSVPEKLPNDIFTRPRDSICFKLVGKDLICWRKDFDASEWSLLGLASIVSGKGGSVALLRALKLEFCSYDEAEPTTDWEPSPDFSSRVSKAIEKIIHVQKKAQSAFLRLVPDVENWKVFFIESEHEEIINEIRLEATGDLINLLTLPLSKGRPIWLDSKQFVEWNCFHDINYGALEALRPVIETGAPKTSRKPLPTRIRDLVILMEEKTMEIVLFHDNKSCPIVQEKGETHNACWRLRPKDSSEIWIDRLFSKPLTAKEIYGLLSPGQIFEKDKKYSINLLYEPRKIDPEFCVFNEESWIRSLFRRNGIDLKSLPPGTFLRVKGQKWKIDLSTQENGVIWTAESDVTGFLFGDRSYEFNLNPMFNFETAKADAIEKITQQVPLDKIANPEGLEDKIEHILERYGFGESGPECHLDVSLSGQTLKIILKQVGGGKSIVLNEDRIKLDNTLSRTSLMEGLSEQISSIELNVTNHDEFMKKLESLLEDLELSDESIEELYEEDEMPESHDESQEPLDSDYESELLEVIEEYRKELESSSRARANLGHSLILLARHRFEQGNPDDAIEIIDESIRILSVSEENDYAIRRCYADTLITKCEILLSTLKPPIRTDVFEPLLTAAIRTLTEISPSGKIVNHDKEKLNRIKEIAMMIDLELPL